MEETIKHRGGKRSSSSRIVIHEYHFSCILSADVILSRLPLDSVLRCRHVCKTWRAVIDDPSRKILMTSSSSIFPVHITINILSRLPADFIIQCCRCVCKTWLALIDHPSFAETHTCRLISSSSSSPAFNNNNKLTIKKKGTISSLFQCAYQSSRNKFGLHFVVYKDDNAHDKSILKGSGPITYFPFDLDYDKWGLIKLSSCNGLVFIGSSKTDVNDVLICNPFTREYVNLLRRSTYHEGDGYMVYGFGYHPRSSVYKVVSIYFRKRNDAPGVVSVYTLGSGSGWRNIGEIPYKFFNRRPGMLVNGVIHWMNRNDDNYTIIVSFDLADEKFRIIPSPPTPPSSGYFDQLGVLGGCLCVTRSFTTHIESPKDIWVLNIHKELEEEDQYSWKIKFRVPWECILSSGEPRVIMQSGRILCRFFKYFVSYDPKTKKGKPLDQGKWLKGAGNPWTEIVPYVKSFVSLKALGEGEAKCFRGMASRPA